MEEKSLRLEEVYGGRSGGLRWKLSWKKFALQEFYVGREILRWEGNFTLGGKKTALDEFDIRRSLRQNGRKHAILKFIYPPYIRVVQRNADLTKRKMSASKSARHEVSKAISEKFSKSGSQPISESASQ